MHVFILSLSWSIRRTSFCIVDDRIRKFDTTSQLLMLGKTEMRRRLSFTLDLFPETESKSESVIQVSVNWRCRRIKDCVNRVNIQTQGKAGLDACHHTCLLRARIRRHKRANLFMAPHHSRYGPRAVLHRSSVDCEIWFHEGIDKIWGPMNTEYHFCRLQPLWISSLWTRGGCRNCLCNKLRQNGAVSVHKSQGAAPDVNVDGPGFDSPVFLILNLKCLQQTY